MNFKIGSFIIEKKNPLHVPLQKRETRLESYTIEIIV